MNRDLFWLTDEQFRRIEPHLPTDTRGKARVDDRRVISGIVHVLKSGRALDRRAGRTTKIHALTDTERRPIAFMLTGGQVPDCVAGGALIEHLPEARLLNGDKGYDSNAIRRQVEARGVMPNIPPKVNRRWKTVSRPCFTEIGTPSSACSAASRISGASRPGTTDWRSTSSPPSASQPSSATGYESGP